MKLASLVIALVLGAALAAWYLFSPRQIAGECFLIAGNGSAIPQAGAEVYLLSETEMTEATRAASLAQQTATKEAISGLTVIIDRHKKELQTLAVLEAESANFDKALEKLRAEHEIKKAQTPQPTYADFQVATGKIDIPSWRKFLDEWAEATGLNAISNHEKLQADMPAQIVDARARLEKIRAIFSKFEEPAPDNIRAAFVASLFAHKTAICLTDGRGGFSFSAPRRGKYAILVHSQADVWALWIPSSPRAKLILDQHSCLAANPPQAAVSFIPPALPTL